jgi:hypothetical protein
MSRQNFEEKNKLSRCRRFDLVITVNVEYIFFISFAFVFFETIMSINEMSSDETTARFAIFFDFLTLFFSTILLIFKFDESMFLLRSTSSAILRNVSSIFDKSFDSERLFFIARLSRVDDDDDEIIDVDCDKKVVSRIEKND